MNHTPEPALPGDIVQYGFKQDIKYSGALGIIIGGDEDGRVLVMWHTRKGNTLFELHDPTTLRPFIDARCPETPQVRVRGRFFVR